MRGIDLTKASFGDAFTLRNGMRAVYNRVDLGCHRVHIECLGEAAYGQTGVFNGVSGPKEEYDIVSVGWVEAPAAKDGPAGDISHASFGDRVTLREGFRGYCIGPTINGMSMRVQIEGCIGAIEYMNNGTLATVITPYRGFDISSWGW